MSDNNPDYDDDDWDWPGFEPGEPRDRCSYCGAEVDHYLGCPDDPDPDYETEAAAAAASAAGDGTVTW